MCVIIQNINMSYLSYTPRDVVIHSTIHVHGDTCCESPLAAGGNGAKLVAGDFAKPLLACGYVDANDDFFTTDTFGAQELAIFDR